jgi:dipeptidyl aminopeptidase/acylaminoacyl peptidase
MKIPQYEADRFRIMRYDLQSGEVENLTEDFQVNPSDIIISPDGKKIYFTGDKEGRMRIFVLNTKNKKVEELAGDHSNTALNLAGDYLYFLQQSFVSPYEVYRLNLKNKKIEKLSAFNDKILDNVKFGEVEEFWFTDRDGIKVHGWLLKPVDFDKNKKYPLAFYIHGGPQGAWHDGFHFRWNLEIAPSHGYVMVAINFRGSTGYGDAFREAISRHWGDRPFNDLMDGLAFVLKKYPFIDENRKGALGASYGGYMINYLMGKAPDQFDAFVNHDGLFDVVSMYYETEELWFPEHEFGGTPWQNADLYKKFNPMTYVTN